MSADSFVGLPYKLCDYVKAGLGVVSSLSGECNSLIMSHGVGVDYVYGDVQSLVSAFEKWRKLQETRPDGDFSGLLSKLDSNKIYNEYVRKVTLGK
jgi:hypothetical protein